MVDDIYSKYVRIRCLHRRFNTNNVLFKMRIKEYNYCNLCYNCKDSNENMLCY